LRKAIYLGPSENPVFPGTKALRLRIFGISTSGALISTVDLVINEFRTTICFHDAILTRSIEIYSTRLFLQCSRDLVRRCATIWWTIWWIPPVDSKGGGWLENSRTARTKEAEDGKWRKSGGKAGKSVREQNNQRNQRNQRNRLPNAENPRASSIPLLIPRAVIG
jgi:hypothetical protein